MAYLANQRTQQKLNINFPVVCCSALLSNSLWRLVSFALQRAQRAHPCVPWRWRGTVNDFTPFAVCRLQSRSARHGRRAPAQPQMSLRQRMYMMIE